MPVLDRQMTLALPASDDVHRFAEGPVWDGARRRLLWVDVLAGSVFEGTLECGRLLVTRQHAFDGTVGAVTFADDGALLVAAQEQLVLVRPDGTRSDGPRVVPVGHPRRLGGGATDPAGRFLVGTLCLAGPSEHEVLVRLERDGWLTLLDGDLALSNGLAWSSDGRSMYSADTLRRTIFVRDYEPSTGVVGERRVHLRTDDGLPAGLAVDAEDHLWVALHGRGEVCRVAPDGTVVDRIEVPAPHTTGVAFAGDDLRTLVVTTAGCGLAEEARSRFPDSGRLFTTRLGVPGLPGTAWSGATL